jgi:hypothetical protein
MRGDIDRRPGLCATCAHARSIESVRGARFLLCALSYSDARFARYPTLPVLDCTGYRHVTGTERTGVDETPRGSRWHSRDDAS